ncbi:MAG: DUF6781 family protein [Pseudomonadota bacterium]|nr:DUF6781 family protein [Pseudomonadota bacterium]
MKTVESNLRNNEKLQDEIKGAVDTGHDIEETVRRITLKALTEGELDTKSVRQVASTVVKGARLGAASHGSEARDILVKAISGLDEALSKAAEASKLALEEAAGRGEEFSSHDLKRALDDMQGLEELFLEALRDAAKGGKDRVSVILHDLAEHAQRSGTAVGAQLKDGLTELVDQVTDAGKDRLESGGESAKTTASLLARLASGLLEGIADSLHPSDEVESRPDKQSPDKSD